MSQPLLVAASGLIVVILAWRVGGEGESQALIVVAAAAIALLAVTVPSWLLAIGGALVFAAGYSVVGVPLPEVGAALMIVGTLMSAGTRWRLPSVLLFSAPLFLVWIAFLSLGELGNATVNKRFLSLLLWLTLIVVLSLPNSNRSWIARGLLAGLLASLPAALLLGSGYGDRGAGFVGDPNAFAMVVAIATPLIVDQLALTRWRATSIWAVSAVVVIAADSRTGMAALLVAALVYRVVPWLRLWAMGIPLLAVAVTANVPDDVVRAGRWEDRAGSDELRERIDAASSRQIADSPWTGHGLGSGKVDLRVYGEPPQDFEFFLHNSYKSLVTELGLIGLGLYAVVALGAVWQAARGIINRGALAAIASGAVMATQLGEVLLAVPMALAFGFGWGTPAGDSPSTELSIGHPGLEHLRRNVPATP